MSLTFNSYEEGENQIMTDLWEKTNKQIMKAAEKKYNKKNIHAIEVNKGSGLFAEVKMSDGQWVTVYDREV